MSNMIRKAARGNEAAVLGFYDKYKAEVLQLCYALLADGEEAKTAAISVFAKLFANLTSGKISTEEALIKALTPLTAQCCKDRIGKKSSRAFRVPANSDFSVAFDASKMNRNGGKAESVLRNLPALHRFIYVLTARGYAPGDLTALLGINTRAVENALALRNSNLQSLSGDPAYTAEVFAKDLAAANAEVSAAMDTAVAQNVHTLCLPLQKQQAKKKKTAGILAAAVIAVALAVGLGLSFAEKKNAYAPPEDLVTSYYADIKVKDYGTITVALNAEAAPKTVENFVNLADEGFYDGLTFHRIMEGFMMQGGDPDADGTGGNTDENGKEINIDGEFKDNGVDNPLSHVRGAISMARGNAYNSASSQFFIVHEDALHLDGQYACFGYVTEGFQFVEAICKDAKPTDDNGTIARAEQPIIESVTIREGT